jgi:hypothetical protein
VSLLVDCAGAPRDLGLDQGRACRGEIGDRFAELSWAEALALRLGRVDAPVRSLQRDLARHFPHLFESLAGHWERCLTANRKARAQEQTKNG